jgi:hypothetical protein
MKNQTFVKLPWGEAAPLHCKYISAANYSKISISRGVLYRILLAFMCSALLQMSFMPEVSAEQVCRTVREVHISWTEEHDGSTSRRIFTETVLHDALREAVQEGVGLEIRSLNSIESTTTISRYKEKVQEIAYQRVQGFIVSYRILSSKWGGGREKNETLTIALAARVCVPYESSLPEIIAFRTFRWANGRADHAATEVAAAAVPQSDEIMLSSSDSGEGYRDVEITGEIDGPKIYDRDRSNEIAAVAHYLGSYSVRAVHRRYREIALTLRIKAHFMADESAVSQVITMSGPIYRGNSMEEEERSLINKAARKAIPRLVQKIEAHRRD